MERIRHLASVTLLIILRLTISAWVGAAILFVITSVAEQTAEPFDSLIRDQLATIRFPHYYRYGFYSLGITIGVGAMCFGLTSGCQRKRILATLVFTIASAAVAVYDYQNVYLPLQAAITPPGQARTQQFQDLHRQSTQINIIHLSLALIAAAVANSSPASGKDDSCRIR